MYRRRVKTQSGRETQWRYGGEDKEGDARLGRDRRGPMESQREIDGMGQKGRERGD